MKALLAVLPLILTVVAEPPAPYPPSGFRPNGPAFELPQKQSQNPQQQQYLPPLDPRRPATPENAYGPPEEDDVSVQGLPTQEQLPIFQPSPINGQQYVGPALQKDIKNLDDSYRQQQYQLQQEKYREYERQRQLEAQANNERSNPVAPRQFGRTTPRPVTSTTQRNDDDRTVTSTTESIDLNEGETLEDDSKKAKVTVEVTKQNLQEYPGEFYLSSLARLQLQPQFVPFQFSQLRAPLIVQPQASQKQVTGYDAQTHFAALPSVLAQQQAFEQSQQAVYPDPAFAAQNQRQFSAPVQPLNQQQFITPAQVNQYQPLIQPQIQQVQGFPQIQAQQVVLQPQTVNQPQFYPQPSPDTEQIEEKGQQDQPQPQFVYQPQSGYQPQQGYQPQAVYQPQPAYQSQYPQTQLNQEPQNVFPQAQYVSYPNQDLVQYQNGFQPQLLQQQPQFVQQAQFGQQQQGQDAFLQSGLDLNKQGNGVEQEDKEDSDDENQGATATAVATAFGTRTQPRVQYGVPFPREQAYPGYQTTTESSVEATTVDGPAVAEATAVANPGRRKSAKLLRSRRIRPIFTLDKSGHLVLAEQN